MAYADQLRDPRWQKKRLEIFQRDNFTCVSCGNKTKNLQAHHAVYPRKAFMWELPLEFFQTLCFECHAIRQELTDKIVDALRISIKDVPAERLEIVAKRFCAMAIGEM